nr:ATP-binding protein [SAR86 cluster bacterium]
TSEGKATGIQKVLLEGLYNKKSIRAKTKSGLNVHTKRPDITRNEFLEKFGIVDGKQSRDDRNTSSRVLALAKQLDRAISNQSIREVLIEDGNNTGVIESLADGKSAIMFSREVDSKASDSSKFDFYGLRSDFHDAIEKGKAWDRASIGRAYDKVYGKSLKTVEGKSLRGLVLDEYAKILRAPARIRQDDYTNKLSEFKSVEELVTQYVEDGAIDETLRKFLGLDNPMATYFSDPAYKSSYRGFINDIIEDLISKGQSREEVFAKILVAKGFIESGTDSPKRSMAFNNKQDLIDGLLSNILPGIKSFTQSSSKGVTTIKLSFKDGSTKTLTTTQQPSQKVSKSMVDGSLTSEEKNLRNKAARESWDLVNNIMSSASALVKAKNNDYSNVEFAMLNAGFLGSMKSPLRAAAALRFLPVNVNTKALKDANGNRLWEYEHGIPAKALAVMLVDHHFNGNKINLDKLRDSYSVGIIHRDMNDNFGRIFKDRMQFGYEIGDSPLKRWYNFFTQSGNLHAVKDINTGEVYGEHYAKISTKLLETVDEGKLRLTIKEARSKKIMHSKENKGASIWDFDDTLARTQSGVRYKLPNPSGTPQPGRKAIFLAGGAGSGKSGVVKSLGLQDQGFKVVNSDISLEWLKKNADLPTDMRDLTPEQASQLGKLNWEARKIAKRKQGKFKGNGDGIVIDGTGGSINVMKKKVQEFRDAGYDVQMIFVETSLDIALERNANRKERSLKDGIVKSNHKAVQGNKEGFKELFGDRFAEVNTDKLSQTSPMPRQLA